MANTSSNPWSLTSTDVASAAITSATLNADGTVTVVCGALTFNATADSTLGFTIINSTLAAYVGFYRLIVGVSGGTSFVLVPQFNIPAGTAAAGAAGTIAQCLYRSQIRIEDISWQNATAAGHTLDLRDRSGNPIWQATATGAGSQNRGKVYWVNGLTPIVIQSGVVLATVD